MAYRSVGREVEKLKFANPHKKLNITEHGILKAPKTEWIVKIGAQECTSYNVAMHRVHPYIIEN